MSLPRCTSRIALLLGGAFVLAGCETMKSLVVPPEIPARTAPVAVEEPIPVEIPAEVMTRYEQAVADMAAGDLLEAELQFKEFALNYPSYPGSYVNLAIIHNTNGKDDAARASLAQALNINPGHPAALNQLGMMMRRKGEFKEAEAAYMKAVTVNPNYALAHFNLGVLNELYLQRLDVALQHYQRFQELSGGDDQVAKWIVDVERRITARQRSAKAGSG